MRHRLPALLVLCVTGMLAPAAHATVTAISSGGSDGTRYPIVDGDSADDSIVVTCGTDGNVKINGLDPVARSGTPGPVPIACANMTGIDADGGEGADTIDFRGITPAAGFTSSRLCAPCDNGGYTVHTECDAGGGDDVIFASPIGSLIGGCGSGPTMPGLDVVFGGPGDDSVSGGPGDDQISAGLGRDYIDGNGGADRLRGNAGGDWLFGGPGDDALHGGPGRDECDGGAGADTARSCEHRTGI